MDDKHKRIKASVEFYFDRIASCNKTIKALRDECDHPERKPFPYQWDIEDIKPNTDVCAICEQVIYEPSKALHIQDSDQSINP